jgi:hypothetical protein
LYCLAVIRHRAFRRASPVWSLAEQCDYARWCRGIGAPNTPEIEAWIGSGELDLDETEFRTVTLH